MAVLVLGLGSLAHGQSAANAPYLDSTWPVDLMVGSSSEDIRAKAQFGVVAR